MRTSRQILLLVVCAAFAGGALAGEVSLSVSVSQPLPVRVTEGGVEREVLGVDELKDGSWQGLIWFDSQEMTEADLHASARSLAEAGAALAGLGSVEMVLASEFTDVWMDPTDDEEEIGEALEEVWSTSFERVRPAPGWPVQRLLAWLPEIGARGPRVLLLGLPLSGESDGGIGGILASMGWVVVVLDPRSSGASRAVADATGGIVSADPSELREFLTDLTERSWVRYRRPEEEDDGRAHRLQVRQGGAELTAAKWGPTVAPEAVGAARAARYLRTLDAGVLGVEMAAEVVGVASVGEALRVEVGLDLGDIEALSSDQLRVTLLLQPIDGGPTIFHRRGKGRELIGSDRWVLEATLPLIDDLTEVSVVVEDLVSGEWGAIAADPEVGSLGILGDRTLVESVDLLPSTRRAETATETLPAGKLIRLVPLGTRQATGTQTFKTLTLNDSIRRVKFLLDGEEVDEDRRGPFSGSIDLGDEVRVHQVTAIALDSKGRELARDTMEVNPSGEDIGVHLSSEVTQVGQRALARVSVVLPTGERLERIELWWNETALATSENVPFSMEVDTPPSGTGVDYLRAVAYLADGSSLEDVQIFSAAGPVEEVEVNLVEIYAVAVDRDGLPIDDLTEAEFEVTLAGREVSLERFGRAEGLPLGLGLVIDTSLSMEPIMADTKAAALKFLTDLVEPGDKAFVVDFDTQPRLATAMTDEVPELFRALASLDPGGATAMYDAIVFSMLHYEPSQDRRALVLLTDGDDYRSRFGVKGAIEQAKAAAVPVYIVSLAGLDVFGQGYRRVVSGISEVEVEAIARETGGRVFYVTALEELDLTYSRISSELAKSVRDRFSQRASPERPGTGQDRSEGESSWCGCCGRWWLAERCRVGESVLLRLWVESVDSSPDGTGTRTQCAPCGRSYAVGLRSALSQAGRRWQREVRCLGEPRRLPLGRRLSAQDRGSEAPRRGRGFRLRAPGGHRGRSGWCCRRCDLRRRPLGHRSHPAAGGVVSGLGARGRARARSARAVDRTLRAQPCRDR